MNNVATPIALGIGPITLWVALFWGTPDIADAIIFFLMK